MRRPRRPRRPILHCVAKELCDNPTGRLVLIAALLVGVYSISLGAVQIGLGATQPMAVAGVTVVGNCVLCTTLYAVLRGVDATMAKVDT